jgi:hypothetical protein
MYACCLRKISYVLIALYMFCTVRSAWDDVATEMHAEGAQRFEEIHS